MYVVIVYDVGVERVNGVRKFLRQYLLWRQNSVFEGELTLAEYERVREKIFELIDPEVDSVIIYRINDKKWLNTEEIGISKTETTNII